MLLQYLALRIVVYAATLVCASSRQDTCNRSMYPMEERLTYERQENFKKQWLISYFTRELRRMRNTGESGILVTSDTRLLNELRNSPPVLALPQTGFKVDRIHTPAPLALFYRIGSNAFFEYRDVNGKTGWEVLAGHNVLSRTVSGVDIHFFGQSWVGEDFSAQWRRTLAFVLPGLEKINKEVVLSIIGYYDNMFSCPNDLDIELYASYDDAFQTKRFNIPSIHSIARLQSDGPSRLGFKVLYYRTRLGTTYLRRLRVYDRYDLIDFDDAVTFKP